MAKKGLTTIEVSTNFSWSAETGDWTTIAIATSKKDGLQIGEPEAFTEEHANELEYTNGFRWRGVIPFEEGTSDIPADNTAFWIAVTPHTGNREVMGGSTGCIGRTERTGLAPLGSAQPLSRLVYSFVATSAANGIKDVAAA